MAGRLMRTGWRRRHPRRRRWRRQRRGRWAEVVVVVLLARTLHARVRAWARARVHANAKAGKARARWRAGAEMMSALCRRGVRRVASACERRRSAGGHTEHHEGMCAIRLLQAIFSLTIHPMVTIVAPFPALADACRCMRRDTEPITVCQWVMACDETWRGASGSVSNCLFWGRA